MRRSATLGSYERFVATTVVEETATPVDEDVGLITTAQSRDVMTDEVENETGFDSASHNEVSATDRQTDRQTC